MIPFFWLIQLKKYAQRENLTDLLNLFDQIAALTKKVNQEIYGLLVNEFKYFE